MSRTYLRGDLYYADLGHGIGSEQKGTRPVVIIQNNVGNKHSPTVIIAAVTSKANVKAKLPTHYLTSAFPKLLEKNGLRRIRFHDLRHSCASLLLANGVPMKQIQEWLGHSDFSTTANVYAHLDYNSKLSSADAMVNGLSGALQAIK